MNDPSSHIQRNRRNWSKAAAADATTTYPFVDAAWARKWPAEEIRKAVKKS